MSVSEMRESGLDVAAEQGNGPDVAAHDENGQTAEALVGRLFMSLISAAELYSVYFGDRMGWYRALADHGPLTSGSLAERTATSERYAREWLEQQAVAGILIVDDAAAESSRRGYSLPDGHAEVLLNRDSLLFGAPMARIVAGMSGQLEALAQAYRTGGGVPYAAFGADAREGQADMNRPLYLNLLGQAWLPAIPDLHARLQAQPAARVADVGCGTGWSSIAIARAYPGVTVDGFDSDDASIALARANAEAAGVADRVRFRTLDGGAIGEQGPYHLVCLFETLHDMAQPVATLRAARENLAPDGQVLVVDEGVGDQFTAPGNEVERLFYAASLLFCLPTGMAGTPSAATGAVMRPATLRQYADQAGFGQVEDLPIQHDFWRFYRLTI